MTCGDAGETRPSPSVSPRRKTNCWNDTSICQGLTKQDYITSRMLERPITVNGNPRVYKALRDELAEVLEQLRKIEAGNQVDTDLLAVISMIATVMDGMKGSDTI